jgi:VanZ family protein
MRLSRFVRYWLPVLVWMGLIFLGSTDLLSAEQTSRIIGPLLRWLKPNISAEAIAQIQFFVRKGAHITEYAILGALLWRALRGTTAATKMSILAVAALSACAIFALSDEFHQSFVASRTASPVDVLIDICGALAALAFCWLVQIRKAGKQESQSAI